MQQQPSPVASQELAQGVQAHTTGPVLLDLSLQALVSGGAPKGGWVPPVQEDVVAGQGNW